MSAAEPSTLDERRTLDDRRRGRMTRSACAGPPRASPSSTYPKHDLQPGEVLTAKRRALILAAGGELPRAVRRPPHPCANEYALQRLGPDGELVPAAQEFLAAHPAWLQERAQSYIDGANTRWPEAHNQRATLARMVKQTCSSSARSKYSLHNLVSSLHRQRRRPGGYKTLCARCAKSLSNQLPPCLRPPASLRSRVGRCHARLPAHPTRRDLPRVHAA